jgi:hypothetical protein
MDPCHVAKQIIIKSVRKWYDEECKNRNVSKIIGTQLQLLIENLYESKEKNLKKKITKGITELCDSNKYGGTKGIENIIDDIFADKNFAKNRLKTELELHQATK